MSELPKLPSLSLDNGWDVSTEWSYHNADVLSILEEYREEWKVGYRNWECPYLTDDYILEVLLNEEWEHFDEYAQVNYDETSSIKI